LIRGVYQPGRRRFEVLFRSDPLGDLGVLDMRRQSI
jgi:hypothetical protein